MQQALTSPVYRSIAIGAVLLTLSVVGVGAANTRCCSHARRLVLHSYEQAGAVYISAWRNGDVRVEVPHIGTELAPLVFKTKASVSDGCRWLATETLTPMHGGRYFYDYSETLLSCDPGATPCIKTPRTGYVTIVD